MFSFISSTNIKVFPCLLFITQSIASVRGKSFLLGVNQLTAQSTLVRRRRLLEANNLWAKMIFDSQ